MQLNVSHDTDIRVLRVERKCLQVQMQQVGTGKHVLVDCSLEGVAVKLSNEREKQSKYQSDALEQR